MRSGGTGVTIRDCVVEANCGGAAAAFIGGRVERCWFKGLTYGSPGYSDTTFVGCRIENCPSSEYWPSGHGFHCTLRNSGTLAWNYACVGSGGKRIRTSNAAKFAGSVMHGYTTYEAGTTGYVTDDPLFVASSGVDVRRASSAFTCGEVPTAENYGSEYYKYASTDYYGRPITFIDGKPVAGADQMGVFAMFAAKRFSVEKATAGVSESAGGALSIPAGEGMSVAAPAGAVGMRGGLLLAFRVPAGGSFAVTLDGEEHVFSEGTHSLRIAPTRAAVGMQLASTAGTAELLSLHCGAGTALSFR